jgi:hypothetical protein
MIVGQPIKITLKSSSFIFSAFPQSFDLILKTIDLSLVIDLFLCEYTPQLSVLSIKCTLEIGNLLQEFIIFVL